MTSYDRDKVSDIHRHLHSELPSEPALRVKALESLLVAKGLVDSQAVDKWVEMFSDEIGPKRGASIVARAWVDNSFRARLLEDGTTAIADFGYVGHATGYLTVVENTPAIHNLVVCTLCSCYPLALLGMAPSWYKQNAYRARAVRDPRGVLSEFGVKLAEDVEVRVWDSTSERRYMVMPQRPRGAENMAEADLAKLVTRDSMIGTAICKLA